jgi:hypothetical protein
MIIAATIVGLTVLTSRAGAAIIVTDGTLHVLGYDRILVPTSGLPGFRYELFPVAPPDTPLVPPYNSAEAGRDYPARESVSSGQSESVVISTDTWSPAVASGSLDFTEDAPETIRIGISSTNSNKLGHVSLDAVGGGNVFSIRIGGLAYEDPPDLLASLSPGQYTLTWSNDGPGGYKSFYITMSAVPEPSCGLPLVAPAAMAFTRRRGRGA